MKKICLEYLEPGMVVAKDVKGPDGNTAVAAGTIIDESILDALETLGAGFAYVTDSPETDDELLMERVTAYVHKFFEYVDPDCPAFEKLFQLTMQRTWDAVSQGWDLPCESELTAQSVEHLRDIFFKDRASVEDLVKHETSLSSFPDLYIRVKQVLDSPNSSAEDVAEVVSMDPGMSAKLLMLVNSPIYGFEIKVDSIPHAVSLVGTEEISTLALGISTVNFFKDIPPELIDMKAFWRHSLSCAMFAKLLGAELKLPAERLFTAGLLHDAGRLIMYKNLPYASVQSLLYARGNGVPLVEAEQEILGFDHTLVADHLLKQWDFPEELRMMVVKHHSPMDAPDSKSAALVQLADNMANAAAISSGWMYVLPGMPLEAWELLDMDEQKLALLLQIHDKSIDSITSLFQ